MDIVTRLVADISELGRKLRKFYEFYYALKEASSVPIKNYLNPYSMPDNITEYRISEDEYKCWQRVKSLISNFEVP